MKRRKYTETNVPAHLVALVRYDRGDHFVTYCKLIDRASRGIVAAANAVCSLKDQPSKKIGRAIAIGRALKFYHSTTFHLKRSETNE